MYGFIVIEIDISYSTEVLYSRDQYEIIRLCKSSHFIKQLCSSICLKKHLQCIKVVEIMQYLGGKSNISICSKHLKSQALPKFSLPNCQPASQPAIRPGCTSYKPPDFSQFIYSRAGFLNFSICSTAPSSFLLAIIGCPCSSLVR